MAMPPAWQLGYDWANNDQDDDIDNAIEAAGYALDSSDAEQFTIGAWAAMQENADCNFTGEEWAS